MKKQTLNILLAALVIVAFNVDANAQKKKKKGKKAAAVEVAPVEAKMELNNVIDSVSYAIGLNMTTSIKKDFAEANFDAFVAGIKAGMKGEGYIIQPEQIQTIVGPYFQKKQEAAKAEELKKSENVKVDGLKFLEENKKKEGVVTTVSGLQYVVLKEGTGKVHPSATDKVEVHYHGTTPEGAVFDSSVDRGKTISFGLNQVIKGWTEGVQLMTVGAKYKFFIPQELAYGANAPQGGSGPIKPFMPLVFEVELFKIGE